MHALYVSGDESGDLLWLGMRTRDGVAAAAWRSRPAVVDWLLAEALAETDGERIRPTLRGFLFANQIAARITAAPGR